MSTHVHWRTPSLAVNDGRGVSVRQVAYLRKEAGGPVQALVTRQLHDVRGRLIEQWDPRLFGVTPTPNLAAIHRLSGEAVRVDSVDAGWRVSLAGVGGEVLDRWDQRGTHWHTTYDDQLRLIALKENAQANVERFTYADATANAGHNLRGQMIEQVDPSGTVSVNSYSLTGQVSGETRGFAGDAAYSSHRTFSALGSLLEQTDAMAHQQLFGYDIAGQLKQVQLKLDPSATAQDVLVDARYNAASQLIEQRAGNGVVSSWAYDPANGWLAQQRAGLPGQPPLQALGYAYDRVGNVLAIDDLAFTRVFFANQLIDGQREFSYDSLYQMRSATGFETDTPHLQPGLPTPVTPIDSGRLYNYAQQYEYDTGGNLTTLRHVRTGNNHTQITRIAPDSNRGVRWIEGEPAPIFDEHFDAHGNLLLLQKGQPLIWNSRDQLAVARLVERSGGPNDEETYVYSQGQRVSKRLVTQAQSVSHVRQVLYLPGLEIRTLDNDEELHVITLDNARCLHWVKGKPGAIEQNQLRFSLDDHLGSSTLELDRNGALISQEIYYPFGGTAWWAARSAVEVDYKTIRYSGKEMDVSGLYYYGARYYAPWLQRWVSADPGGDVDGLNLYGFVGNNPLCYIDDNGQEKTRAQHKRNIVNQLRYLSAVNSKMQTTEKQFDALSRPRDFRINILKNTIYLVGSAVLGYFTAYFFTKAAFPGTSSIPSAIQGLTLGNASADINVGFYEKLMEPLKLNTPFIPRLSELTPEAIASPGGKGVLDNLHFSPSNTTEIIENFKSTFGVSVNSVGGAHIPAVAEMFQLAKVATDANRAEEGLFTFELDAYDSRLDELSESVIKASTSANKAFEALGEQQFYENFTDRAVDIWRGRVGASNSKMVTQSTVHAFTERALDSIKETKLTLARYRAHVSRTLQKRAA